MSNHICKKGQRGGRHLCSQNDMVQLGRQGRSVVPPTENRCSRLKIGGTTGRMEKRGV